MLPSKLLIAVLLLLGALAVSAPLHLLLLLRFPLVALQGHWSVAGVRFDAVDLVLGFLLLLFLLRRRKGAEDERHRIPYFSIWLVLGLLLSVSYLITPDAREHITAAHRAGYQLYRYCWKVILFFPLVFALLDNRAKLERALWAVVLAGDILAFHATVQGYSGGDRATGPFSHPNALAGALVAPLLLSLIGSFSPQIRYRLFWLASSALMLRGMLFTGSRGGAVSVAAGVLLSLALLSTRRYGRAQLGKLVPAALVVGLLVFWIKPDVLERPTIRRAMTARQGIGAETMQWRLQERWPIFLETLSEHPWLGTGSAVDAKLAEEGGAAGTHNGYLAIAVESGIPATLLYILLAVLALRNGLRLFSHAADPWQSALGLVLTCALAGVLVHNVVDATIRLAFVRDLFWLLCALSARAALMLDPSTRQADQSARPAVLAHGVPH